ncbi:MAG TPA: hypothetical protein VLL73_00190 [Desulfurivibrionaceae bacterium]|nr:hypothetical protein [Desulfurivibrionaceae bacterium]
MLHRNQKFASVLLILALFALTGCAQLGWGGSTSSESAPPEAAATNQPYSPAEFRDLIIPGELAWNRDKSMVIKTDSYAGGVLNFSGKVDINSLADFFAKSMERNGWKLAGSIKYKQVLLAFVKPAKTCTITIADSEFGLKTEVNVYVTEDITKRDQPAPAATGTTRPGGY